MMGNNERLFFHEKKGKDTHMRDWMLSILEDIGEIRMEDSDPYPDSEAFEMFVSMLLDLHSA